MKDSEKIKTCKPSLINNRADFNYRFEYEDSMGAKWDFGLHTMNAKQAGAVMSSLAVVRLSSDGKTETEIETNMALVHTATVYNALDNWNLDEPITIANIDMMPSDVRNALVQAIEDHENKIKSELSSHVKN